MVVSKIAEKPNDWHAICKIIELWQFSEGSIVKSSKVSQFYRFFGYPSQIGIMCGRGNYLKLMKQQFGSKSRSAHIDYLLNIIGDSWSINLSSYSDLLQSAEENIRPAINIDIGLNNDTLLPQIGIEIHYQGLLGRKLPGSVMRILSESFDVDSSQLNNLEQLLSTLPKGVRSVSGKTMDEHHRIRVAKFSHIKVVLSPLFKPRIKSYVRLVEQCQ